MLLSDPTILAILRDDLVPCWESVQDTAKVTISFADGKTLKRTIGGNTIIYLCRPDGGVVDAFPGIYTASDFLAEARAALAKLQQGAAATSAVAIRQYHAAFADQATSKPAANIVLSKSIVESPIRDRLRLGSASPRNNATQATTIAPPVGSGLGSRLHDISKQPRTPEQIRRAYLDRKEQEQLSPEAFGQRLVALDSQNNRQLIRPLVHQMMGKSQVLTPSEWKLPMFRELLDTDLSKPYLGLVDAIVPGTSGIIR